jgi:hypothetical protein
MQNALNQLRDWWSNAPRPMRIGILGGVAGLLVLFLALGFWASHAQLHDALHGA